MSDDKKPNPDDAPIVTSLDEITADGPVLWTSDAMVTQGGGAIFAIPDNGACGQWREPWPSAEGGPKHVLSAPVYQDEMPVYTGSAPFGRCPSWRQPVVDDPPPPDPTFLADSALGGVDSHTLPLPLPEYLNRPGRLVRDDAARGWRFEPAVRDE